MLIAKSPKTEGNEVEELTKIFQEPWNNLNTTSRKNAEKQLGRS